MMSQSRMPALFLGHGSPMMVLEENNYTAMWRELGKKLPRPVAMVVISAHWYTRETAVTAMAKPRTIHDFGGFPQALFDIQYPATGSPELAKKIAALLSPVSVVQNQSWGLDHGCWAILSKMYPAASIPVVQLSIDGTQTSAWHASLGQKLSALRDQGILIIASGNVVHNLRMLRPEGAAVIYPWAQAFNQYVCDQLDWQGSLSEHPLVHFMAHEAAALSHPTPEHYLPLLYVLGARRADERITVLANGFDMGALSMLSIQVG